MTTQVILSLIIFIVFCGINITAGLMMVISKTLTEKLIIYIAALFIGAFVYQYQDQLFGDLNDYVKLIFNFNNTKN